MADNYLEKKMEDYRKGPSRAVRSDRKTLSAGGVIEKVPQLRLLYFGSLSDSSAIVVSRLCALGLKVAFTGPNSAEGRRFAQATGALFVPHDALDSIDGFVSAVRQRWGAVNAVVMESGYETPDFDGLTAFRSITFSCGGPSDNGVRCAQCGDSVSVSARSGMETELAKWCAWLLTPAGSHLRGTDLILN